jgi:hypothetical protein
LASPQLSQIAVHTEAGTESATLFLSRDPDVDSEGYRHLVLQRWYLEWGTTFTDNRERVLHLRRKRPATKDFPFVQPNRRSYKISRNQSTAPNTTTTRAILASHCLLNLPPPEQRFPPLLPIRFDIAESGSSQPTELFCQGNKNQVQIEKTAARLYELKHFFILYRWPR